MSKTGEYITAALVLTVLGTGIYSCLPKKGEQPPNSLPANTLSTPKMPEFHVNYNPTPAMKKIVDAAKKQIPSRVFDDSNDLMWYLMADIKIPGKEFSYITKTIDKDNMFVNVSYFEDLSVNPFKLHISVREPKKTKFCWKEDPIFNKYSEKDIEVSAEYYIDVTEWGSDDGKIDGKLDSSD
ncbi:MAG: hypothetical protein V1870_01270, partial [Candidatus Aenigmatarchaeota archaeon]